MNSDRPPETVRAYLDALRRALKGAPPGLIADALADCEDHLDTEIAHNPDLPEAIVLASVVETYGSPQEIAEEYRDMEATISTPFPKQEQSASQRKGFFNVISDPRTYGALLYMLLSLITGIFYFTWTVVGISMTAGFAILILGIPFALLFVGSVRMLSHVEGRIVEALLGVRMPRRPPSTAPSDEFDLDAHQGSIERHAHLDVDVLSAAHAAARRRLFCNRDCRAVRFARCGRRRDLFARHQP